MSEHLSQVRVKLNESLSRQEHVVWFYLLNYHAKFVPLLQLRSNASVPRQHPHTHLQYSLLTGQL